MIRRSVRRWLEARILPPVVPPEPPRPDPGHDWLSPATVVSVVALVVSLFSLYFTWSAADSAKRQAATAETEARRRAVVEVVSARARIADDVPGTEIAPGRSATPRTYRGPQIDIILRNTGSGEGLITDVTVTFEHADRLVPCLGIGGPVLARYDYAIAVPGGPVPFTRVKRLDFAIPSGKHERFTLSVGPAESGEGSAPWTGVLTVTLHHRDGRDLTMGPFALVDAGDPAGTFTSTAPEVWKIRTPPDSACMRENARAVSGLLARRGLVVSPELRALDRALNAYR